MKLKKVIIVLVVLLAVLLVGFLAYNYFLKERLLETEEPEPSQTLNTKVKLISQEKVISFDLSPAGQAVRYYTSSNGNIFEVDFNGQNRTQISKAVLPHLQKVIFSPTDKNQVITVLDQEKYFYNHHTGQSSQLNQNIGWVSFSPDGQQIAYQFSALAKNTTQISLAKPNGSGWKNIFATRLENLIVDWPQADKISLLTPPRGLGLGALYLINIDGSDFTKIIDDIYGLTVKWSPKGDRFIFSSTDEKGKNLALNLADDAGGNQKELKAATLPEKCAWSQDNRNIFCAVPQGASEHITWPDDYQKRVTSTKDDFYKIDTIGGKKTKIFFSTKEKAFDAKDLILSSEENYLFFINQRDGLLYSLELKPPSAQ